jgi:hypothetical protein
MSSTGLGENANYNHEDDWVENGGIHFCKDEGLAVVVMILEVGSAGFSRKLLTVALTA